MDIRALTELHEMYAAVDLQELYWGTDRESVVPAHVLFTIAKSGGHVLVAMDGNRMIGVLIGLIGTDIRVKDRPAMANLLIVSKRMLVLPEYRGQGVGQQLKLTQREIAIKQGIRLVTWTFDPLLAANAYLNLHKLGCICQHYLEDYFGTDTQLASLGSSDRLAVEWWVTTHRVKNRANENRTDLKIEQYMDGNARIVNPTVEFEGFPIPGETVIEPMGAFALLEIPVNYPAIVAENEALAREWRGHTRAAFQYLIRSGFIVTDFLRDEYEGRDRAFYIMSLDTTGFDLTLN